MLGVAEIRPSRRPVRWMAALLALIALVVGAGPSPAHAAGWRLESTHTVTLLTDGARFAVWDGPDAAETTIYDTDSGTRRVVTLPQHCGFLGDRSADGTTSRGAAAGRALLVCSDPLTDEETASVYDLSTGAIASLPSQAPSQPSSVVQYRDIGSSWARGVRSAGCDAQGCHFVFRYVNLTTGQEVESADEADDLDQPTLPPACGPLLAYTDRHGLMGVAGGRYYTSSRHGQHYRVRRMACSAVADVAFEQRPVRSFQAAGGLVSWTTAREPTEYSGPPSAFKRIPAVVGLQSLTGGPVRRWPAPRRVLHTPGDDRQLHGSFGFAEHTRRRVFFVAALALDTAGIDFVDRAALYSRPTGR